jgi:hypothetical protein
VPAQARSAFSDELISRTCGRSRGLGRRQASRVSPNKSRIRFRLAWVREPAAGVCPNRDVTGHSMTILAWVITGCQRSRVAFTIAAICSGVLPRRSN